MTKAKLANHNGYPAIIIDGKPYPPMAMTIRTRTDSKNIKTDYEYYKKLGESGIKIFYVYCETVWLYDNAKEVFDHEASIIIDAVPDAYIIPRISLHPPKKWMDENPDEIVQYSDGKPVITRFRSETYSATLKGMYSLCSEKWRKDAGKALMEMIDYFSGLPYADRIIGYFLAAGGTSEWYYYNPMENFETGAYADTSKAFKTEFEKFLKEKYGKKAPEPIIPDISSRYYAEKIDDEMYNIPRVRPAEPAPKPPKKAAHIGAFLDVDNYQHTADFYRAWHLGTANSIICFAKLLKERDADKLVGAFYGSWGGSEIIWASNAGGVMKLLECPYLDFLSNPGVYENRQPGGFTGQRQMPDSFRLHKKMYIIEEDTRTHAENAYFRDLFELFTVKDTVNVLKRNFGRNICEDVQAWWFDQHIGGGRYKFPEVYSLFKRQQEIAEMSYAIDRKKENEIAFIYDEESLHIVSKQTTTEIVEMFRNYEIAKLGAPADQYYHNDMSDPNMPDYKLYVFFNCFLLSDTDRKTIKNKLSKNHATALFIYASGIVNPDSEKKFSAENVSDLTGMKCVVVDDKITPAFKVNNEKIDYTEVNKIYGLFDREHKNNIGFENRHIKRSYLYPYIAVKDDAAEILATFCENNEAAITRKETGGYTSVFYGAKILSAEILRGIAKGAGCHIYEECGNVLYVNKNFLTIHASHSGRVRISLPENRKVYELYEKKSYGENVKEFELDMKLGETKMFRLEGVK